MIGKLRGRVDEINEDSLILDVGGVGYQVHCSTRTLSDLTRAGEFAELAIETHVREDHIHLYGFADAAEREWFKRLTTVQGVGVKMAMALLGAFSGAQLTQAIAAKDTKMLTRANGVGPKLAERICTELKDKVAKIAVGISLKGPINHQPSTSVPSLNDDAISALTHLGYTRADAFTAVARAAQRLGEEAALDLLIKEGLKELAAA